MTEDVVATLSHCGRPMTARGSRHGWRDEDELATWRFRCDVCDAEATLSTRIPVGPPSGAL